MHRTSWASACLLGMIALASVALGASGPERPSNLFPYQLGLAFRGVRAEGDTGAAIAALRLRHLLNIRRMFETGHLAAAGPIGDDGPLQSVFIFRLQDADSIAALLGDDPLVRSGRLRIAWHRWYSAAGLGREYRWVCANGSGIPDSLVSFSFVLLHRGPRWTANMAPSVRHVLEGHRRNIERLTRAGQLLVAGALEGTGELRGVLIFAADSAEASRLVATDPAVRAGRFVAEIHTWSTLPGVIPGH